MTDRLDAIRMGSDKKTIDRAFSVAGSLLREMEDVIVLALYHSENTTDMTFGECDLIVNAARHTAVRMLTYLRTELDPPVEEDGYQEMKAEVQQAAEAYDREAKEPPVEPPAEDADLNP